MNQMLTLAAGWLLSAGCLAAPSAPGFDACPQFFAQGLPPAVRPVPGLRELCFDAFAVLHSGRTRTPVFVAERLNRAVVADAHEKRTNRFYADARLPRAERAELEDYAGSGYARGHMAPAGDMPTPRAMAQSFSLANMVPQNGSHNSGPWARIERDTRHYAERAQGNVYIITGPVFAVRPDTIGQDRVQVPSALFKLVYDERTGRAWAFWNENREGRQDMRPISYQELTRRTGIQFLPGLSPRL